MHTSATSANLVLFFSLRLRLGLRQNPETPDREDRESPPTCSGWRVPLRERWLVRLTGETGRRLPFPGAPLESPVQLTENRLRRFFTNRAGSDVGFHNHSLPPSGFIRVDVFSGQLSLSTENRFRRFVTSRAGSDVGLHDHASPPSGFIRVD